MRGRPQDRRCPEAESTFGVGVAQKYCVTCANTASPWACREHRNRACGVSCARPRVRFSDAARVRQRVESPALRLRLRGARRHIMRPTQLAYVLTAGGGCYDLKTIGCARTSLEHGDLIDGRPADGRTDTSKYRRCSTDPTPALAHTGRIAAGMLPAAQLADALWRRAGEVLANQVPTCDLVQPRAGGFAAGHLVAEPAVGGCGCVVCGSMRAAARPQPPLKSTVCDRCCSVAPPLELQADNSVDSPAQVVSA